MVYFTGGKDLPSMERTITKKYSNTIRNACFYISHNDLQIDMLISVLYAINMFPVMFMFLNYAYNIIGYVTTMIRT